MIKIAICDDDILFTSYLERELLKYAEDFSCDFDIDICFDGKTLLDAIEQHNHYDLIYLDIRMKQLDGLNTARQIRARNLDSLLIYISAYDIYTTELFEVEPFRFLRKPIDTATLRRYLDEARNRLKSHSNYYTYTYKHCTYRCPLSKILYFESIQRQILLHTKDGNETFYQKLNVIEEELRESTIPFLRIHQSYLVNYYAIKRYSLTKIELSNGTVLPISNERQKKIRNQYHSLMEQGL